MADQYTIEVHLTGDEITPDKIRSRDIATMISAIEVMVAAIVERDNPSLQIDEAKVTVGLSSIQRGSYVMQFESQYHEEVKAAYELIANTIKLGDFQSLPSRSIDAIQRVRNVSREYRTETVLGYRNGDFVPLASVAANTKIDIQTLEVEGETTLYGQLIGISGMKPPEARLILFDGRNFKCRVTERNNLSVARELGKRLYTEIGVRGFARWNMHDMSLTFFRIDELLEYHEIPITDAIENTYRVAGHHLEKIEDVNTYFTMLRDGSEDF